MIRSTDDAIERAKVREVAAIFHSDEALEAAVEALLLAGFDRADIDRLAYVAHEELADVAQTPRQPVFMREDVTATLMVVVGVLASVAGVAAALLVVAFGGGTAAADLLAALIAGTIGALVTARIFRPMSKRCSLSWRRVVSYSGSVSDRRIMRTRHRQILHQLGGQAIRVHEIEIEKRPEEIPLSSLRPAATPADVSA